MQDDQANESNRAWVCEAMNKIAADFNRSSDTHLLKVDLPCFAPHTLYLKDESTHPTGSLKHRLARSLFLYGLANGLIKQGTPIIEASSGSTAISEAYFARLLGLEFIAVIPSTTAQEKIEKIEFYGGKCHKVAPAEIYDAAQRLASELRGHYMDQFTYAERATDWRGNNNIAESLFQQMAKEDNPIPAWVVVSAGTGGTSATLGRYIRYRPELFSKTKLCVVDPENSVFYDFYQDRDAARTSSVGSRIEGIGRPRVEPSFLPSIIDHMYQIPDAASIATIWWLESILDRKCGGSTGTNVYGAIRIMSELCDASTPASIVSILCDPGERYLDTYFNSDWLEEQGIDIAPYLGQLRNFQESGLLNPI
jgi:cysteine synthase A